MHLSTAELRAYLDSALPAAEQAAAAGHLAACPMCAAELRGVDARAARVRDRLEVLAPAPAEAARTAPAALNVLHDRQRKERVPMFTLLAKRRSLWITAAAILALALSFSFAPVRTFAGQFLGLFRVKQIAVLPVDLARLASLHDDPTLSDQITRMFNESVTVTKDPGPTVKAASAAEAGQLAGFAVRELGGATGTPRFTVTDSAGFKVVIDQARAQAILDEAGRGDLQLPASLDGATIEVSIPAGVAVAYNCPDMSDAAETAYGPGELRGNVDELANCVLLGQMPSPSVETPPNLDMVRLAELGLQFTGMSADEARAFSASVDWTSTLVVPIPMNASSAQQVSVDGVTGTLVTRRGDDGVPPRYTLMWVKNGIVYVLSAFGTAQDAVALGNTIR